MNLVTNPWIPCVMLDGTRKTVSLLDLFEQVHQVPFASPGEKNNYNERKACENYTKRSLLSQ